ncbi:MAG: tRNA uridine-5-carboxymethylaminomethyl(34) synthesis GTPase MnmE, partial [Oscillospiraceae bacterium]|nr:tRNA uridine-5-carboxymethylaminomethyl(34) synthesis GTPase MnmE [Oscillospiraceae bacterium]
MSQTPDQEGQSAALDTIAAIATGSGLSAIGIIRVSGPAALAVVDRVFTPMRGAAMSQRPDRQLVLGRLSAPGGALLDQCLATVSRGPNSYTGEDTAELQCHGSPVVLRLGLDSLFAAGARQARAGEFTRRAFINHRMDLTQAEAVIDLIDAETEQAAENAAAQLDGAICRRTDGIYDSLTAICSHYHAVIDYPDEDIEPFALESYARTLKEADSEQSGRNLRG